MTSYKYLGDFSATPPQYSRGMSCDKCMVSWTGCWDNFMCPKCGEGEIPVYGGFEEFFGKLDKKREEK